jgi:hypothetical protein
MAPKKYMWIFFGILVVSVWVLGSAIQVGAETWNYRFYTWVIKGEDYPVGDVEGHDVGFRTRGYFIMYENGEIATANSVTTQDRTKESTPYMLYQTIFFQDGSTIIIKSQGTTVGRTTASSSARSESKSEIIKGTGRFEGIKGTTSSKTKYLPIIRGYGEGTLTYTLPGK